MGFLDEYGLAHVWYNTKQYIEDNVQRGPQGEPGPAGQNGADGFSPIVEVTEIEGGHQLTITDADGSKSFNVMDGARSMVNAPIGAIMAWSKSAEEIPDGWHICDGTNGTIDLRDKFILSAGTVHSVGETGGSEEVTLTVEQMPKHNHAREIVISDGSNGDRSASIANKKSIRVSDGETTYTGNSMPHPNMPPYITLIFIQKIGVTQTDYVTEERVDEKIADALENVPAEEYDTEDGWHVRKWSDGYVEMLSPVLSSTVAVNDWNTWGSVFYGGDIHAQIPDILTEKLTETFSIENELAANYSVGGFGVYSYLYIPEAYNPLIDTKQMVFWKPEIPNNDRTFKARVHITGRWK